MKTPILDYQTQIDALTAAAQPQSITIEQELQSMINAMASFSSSSEGSIQVEDQTYGYLTPITVSNY